VKVANEVCLVVVDIFGVGSLELVDAAVGTADQDLGGVGVPAEVGH
jgi:hypothetical protein